MTSRPHGRYSYPQIWTENPQQIPQHVNLKEKEYEIKKVKPVQTKVLKPEMKQLDGRLVQKLKSYLQQ